MRCPKNELFDDALKTFFEFKKDMRMVAVVELYKTDEMFLSGATELAGVGTGGMKWQPRTTQPAHPPPYTATPGAYFVGGAGGHPIMLTLRPHACAASSIRFNDPGRSLDPDNIDLIAGVDPFQFLFDDDKPV